jgi:quercetin dioxygenase-like cupin family protein
MGKYILTALILTFCLTTAGQVHAAEVTPVYLQALPELSADQEVQMLTVTYAPGEASNIHRHNGHTFVYVLEGTVTMAVKGKDAVTLEAGMTFYETPDDIHTISRNASKTTEAKILVFFLKPRGVPPTESAHAR